jgi:4-hydroxymandelate oxidase
MASPSAPWPINVAGLEELAAAKLDGQAYDYYRSGSGDEVTIARNREAFRRLELLPHVLCDVSEVDLTVELLGRPASPVLVAPTAFHGLADERAELATAAGAAGAGSIFCLSSLSNTTIEAVGEAADPEARRWFQLYVFKDRGLTTELVDRAEAGGFEAIVLTVDAPVLGRRERDVVNGFSLPPNLTIACVGDAVSGEIGESGLAAYFASQLDPSLDWSDLEWLVRSTNLPVLVKGVHRPDDAERAIELGVRGVIVSNHGGRQLDTVPATIEMLPAIAEAVGGETEILLDGGVRRGTDIVKALALGARAVLLGRPILWGLAIDGEDGVRRTLRMLEEELREAMALCGAASPEAIGGDLVVRRDTLGA